MSNKEETKQFHIGDVISAATGILVSPDHIGGVYNILGWMTGEELMTHQLPRVSRECEPSLRAQHPDLCNERPEPGTVTSMETALAFLETLYPKYGRFVPVQRIEAEDHTPIDPIAEIKMMRPDAIIVDLGDGEGVST
jgi:hypothetical protein